ncbi:hypothetical protein ACI3PL_32580, partial [Lacticaseibacillus paracasei]
MAKNSVTDLYTDYALRTLDCYVSMEKLLTDAGFTITDTEPDVDLTELSKDSMISLVSGEKIVSKNKTETESV